MAKKKVRFTRGAREQEFNAAGHTVSDAKEKLANFFGDVSKDLVFVNGEQKDDNYILQESDEVYYGSDGGKKGNKRHIRSK